MKFAVTTIISCTLVSLVLANDTPVTQAQTAQTAQQPTAVASAGTAPAQVTDASEYEQELRRRQAKGQIVGEGVESVPTQQSPFTTYMVYDANGNQAPVVYTQLFSAVPEQWDQPQSGSIGLGTHTGQIGVVKTRTKRNYIAEATALAKRGMQELERRARKGSSGSGGSSGNNTGAAISMHVPLAVMGGAVLVAGLFVADLL